MRTIKFRGKSIYSEWAYGSLVKLDIGFIILTNNKTELDKTLDNNNAIVFSLDDISVVIPETVGQFTGLLDKNGKEIYEGDILVWRYEDNIKDTGYGETYNEVAFQNGRFGQIGEITGELLPFERDKDSWAVAGNIHDNPELPKGGDK